MARVPRNDRTRAAVLKMASEPQAALRPLCRGCAAQHAHEAANHTRCGQAAWLDGLDCIMEGSPAGSLSRAPPAMGRDYIHYDNLCEGTGRNGSVYVFFLRCRTASLA
ncbi:hypothetical protein ACJQWK_10373 [Exserohilum turcicum]